MNTNPYWSSLAAERRQQRRRRREQLLAFLHIEPQRKGRRTDALDSQFRSHVREHLVALGLNGWPRAPLAADFSFVTTRKQPAGIEAYAKHYQDLLEPRGRPDDAPPFLYRSDRQIKMLFVRCSHQWGSDSRPYIGLRCQPRRHALADIEAAVRLGFLEESKHDRHGDPDDAAADARAFSRALRDVTDPSPFDAWLAEWSRHEAIRSLQDVRLHSNDQLLTDVLAQRAASLVTNRPDPWWRHITRLGMSDNLAALSQFPSATYRQLLDMLIRVPLPALPTREGDSNRFRDAVHDACAAFVARYPYFQPLVVPLRITVLVVPPVQGKDLDNIVLAVIGAVNATLRPPPEPWLLTPAPADDGADGWRADALRRLRSKPEVGIVAYQLIELARTPEDPAEGTLSMVLGHGDVLDSIWETAADYVDGVLDDG